MQGQDSPQPPPARLKQQGKALKRLKESLHHLKELPGYPTALDAVGKALHKQQDLLQVSEECWQDEDLVQHAAMHTSRVAQTLLRFMGWLASALLLQLNSLAIGLREELSPNLQLAWHNANHIFSQCVAQLQQHGTSCVSKWGPSLSEQLSKEEFEGEVPGPAGEWPTLMLALLHTPRLPAAAEVVWELLYVWPACIMVADEVSVHTGWLPAWLLASRPCMQALMLRVFMHNTRSLRPELKQRVDGIACQAIRAMAVLQQHENSFQFHASSSSRTITSSSNSQAAIVGSNPEVQAPGHGSLRCFWWGALATACQGMLLKDHAVMAAAAAAATATDAEALRASVTAPAAGIPLLKHLPRSLMQAHRPLSFTVRTCLAGGIGHYIINGFAPQVAVHLVASYVSPAVQQQVAVDMGACLPHLQQQDLMSQQKGEGQQQQHWEEEKEEGCSNQQEGSSYHHHHHQQQQQQRLRAGEPVPGTPLATFMAQGAAADQQLLPPGRLLWPHLPGTPAALPMFSQAGGQASQPGPTATSSNSSSTQQPQATAGGAKQEQQQQQEEEGSQTTSNCVGSHPTLQELELLLEAAALAQVDARTPLLLSLGLLLALTPGEVHAAFLQAQGDALLTLLMHTHQQSAELEQTLVASQEAGLVTVDRPFLGAAAFAAPQRVPVAAALADGHVQQQAAPVTAAAAGAAGVRAAAAGAAAAAVAEPGTGVGTPAHTPEAPSGDSRGHALHRTRYYDPPEDLVESLGALDAAPSAMLLVLLMFFKPRQFVQHAAAGDSAGGSSRAGSCAEYEGEAEREAAKQEQHCEPQQGGASASQRQQEQQQKPQQQQQLDSSQQPGQQHQTQGEKSHGQEEHQPGASSTSCSITDLALAAYSGCILWSVEGHRLPLLSVPAEALQLVPGYTPTPLLWALLEQLVRGDDVTWVTEAALQALLDGVQPPPPGKPYQLPPPHQWLARNSLVRSLCKSADQLNLTSFDRLLQLCHQLTIEALVWCERKKALHAAVQVLNETGTAAAAAAALHGNRDQAPGVGQEAAGAVPAPATAATAAAAAAAVPAPPTALTAAAAAGAVAAAPQATAATAQNTGAAGAPEAPHDIAAQAGSTAKVPESQAASAAAAAAAGGDGGPPPREDEVVTAEPPGGPAAAKTLCATAASAAAEGPVAAPPHAHAVESAAAGPVTGAEAVAALQQAAARLGVLAMVGTVPSPQQQQHQRPPAGGQRQHKKLIARRRQGGNKHSSQQQQEQQQQQQIQVAPVSASPPDAAFSSKEGSVPGPDMAALMPFICSSMQTAAAVLCRTARRSEGLEALLRNQQQPLHEQQQAPGTSGQQQQQREQQQQEEGNGDAAQQQQQEQQPVTGQQQQQQQQSRYAAEVEPKSPSPLSAGHSGACASTSASASSSSQPGGDAACCIDPATLAAVQRLQAAAGPQPAAAPATGAAVGASTVAPGPAADISITLAAAAEGYAALLCQHLGGEWRVADLAGRLMMCLNQIMDLRFLLLGGRDIDTAYEHQLSWTEGQWRYSGRVYLMHVGEEYFQGRLQGADAVLLRSYNAALRVGWLALRPAPVWLPGCANLACNNMVGACELSLVTNVTGVVCGGCGVARYCSQECAKADWACQHHTVCRAMRQRLSTWSLEAKQQQQPQQPQGPDEQQQAREQPERLRPARGSNWVSVNSSSSATGSGSAGSRPCSGRGRALPGLWALCTAGEHGKPSRRVGRNRP